MILGTVNADREPVIRIAVRDCSGQELERTTIVDTGFTGWLTLPPDFITALGLPWKELGVAILADGSQVLFDVQESPGLRVDFKQRSRTPLQEGFRKNRKGDGGGDHAGSDRAGGGTQQGGDIAARGR